MLILFLEKIESNLFVTYFVFFIIILIAYAFDHAFDFQATQREIFESTTQHLVPVILDGFNATVFAYIFLFFIFIY